MAPDVHDRVCGVPYNFAFITFHVLIFVFCYFFYLIGTKSRGNKKSRELIVAQKYCATSRLFVPATFCFLILRDIKFPRLLVLKFCATISSTRLFVPRLFVPATFCSCDFLISNAKKQRDFLSRGKIRKNMHEIKEILKSRALNARH